MRFLSPLPVSRLPGVGKVTQKELEDLGIQTVEHLRGLELEALEAHFGRCGTRLYELARGIDHSEQADEIDICRRHLRTRCTVGRNRAHDTRPGGKGLGGIPEGSRVARTVVLKLKTGDFNILTRSCTPC